MPTWNHEAMKKEVHRVACTSSGPYGSNSYKIFAIVHEHNDIAAKANTPSNWSWHTRNFRGYTVHYVRFIGDKYDGSGSFGAKCDDAYSCRAKGQSMREDVDAVYWKMRGRSYSPVICALGKGRWASSCWHRSTWSHTSSCAAYSKMIGYC